MPTVRRCNWINQNGIQCGMPFGHVGLHGNGLITTGRDTWHEYLGEPQIAPTGEKFGVVWTDKSKTPRCLWHGAHGCCQYEAGHTLPHKEDAGKPLV